MAETRLHELLEQTRPDWDSYFLGLAFVASRRSPDQHTKHGACLVDSRNRRVLSLGYNGFPRGMEDGSLPLSRPSKYAWLDHAEPNAIANLTKDPWDFPVVAYITGLPCFACSKELVRNNIKDWVLAERRGFTNGFEPQEQANFDRLIAECNVKIRTVRPDLNFIVARDFLEELGRHNFIVAAEDVRCPGPVIIPAYGFVRRHLIQMLSRLLHALQP